jgi:hypothetical protein
MGIKLKFKWRTTRLGAKNEKGEEVIKWVDLHEGLKRQPAPAGQ